MTDVKFKAWDRHNKVWLGPYTIKQLADDDQFNYDTETKPVCSKFEDFNWVQFTGKKDQVGVELYDGDCVEYVFNYDDLKQKKKAERYRGRIYWSEEHAGWVVSPHRLVFNCGDFLHCWRIGSLSETPDLLTDKEK